MADAEHAQPGQDGPPRATVLITTKDRRDDLRRAAASVLEQSVRTELLIVDDGSTDGTSDMARAEFPDATLLRNETALGIIAARNRAAEVAQGEVMFTLDDDAVFSAPDTVGRTLAAFEHPRVGIAAIPLVNFINDQRIELDHSPGRGDADFPVLYAFRGGANAVRLDLFRHLGGYLGSGRQGEETTLSIRALDAGYVVRSVDAPAVHHFPSPHRRDRGEVVRFSARNNLVFGWRMAPMPDALVHAAGSAINSARAAAREGRLGLSVAGSLAGVGAILTGKEPRRAVARSTYKLARRIQAADGTMRIGDVESRLPPPVPLG